MTVKLIKQFTKRPDQDWSGIWYFDTIETSKSSLPDSRDVAHSFAPSEDSNLKTHIKKNVRKAEGYEGWDREYVNDNVLRLIWYFQHKGFALDYLKGEVADKQALQSYKNTLTAKKDTYNYTAQWIITDEEGNEQNLVMS